VRDACGFSYISDERGEVLQGRSVDPSVRVVPVETQ
jgi:hypothetical protein